MAYLELVGTHDEDTQTQAQTLAKRPELEKVFVMADGHVGYQSMPIGGVTISPSHIAPGGAGFDIGCGNWAGQTTLHVSDLDYDDLYHIGERISKEIAIGLGIEYGTFADHTVVDDIVKETKHIGIPEITLRNQLGSVGAGNHYIDLMADTDGYIWIALHWGSRKFGHSVAKYYLDLLGAKDGMFSEPTFMRADSEMGMDYLYDMMLAGEYADVGRRLVGIKIATQILHNTVSQVVTNHHNYIWEEQIGERLVYVTRKGATPVYTDRLSFIGGSMGTESVIVKVRDDAEQQAIYYHNSAPHGAGRLIGRSQAKGRFKKGVMTREPRVTQGMMDEWVEDYGVIRFGGDVDESPHCYRNLVNDVLPEHPYLQVVELLRPLVVVMAPARGRR